MYGQHRPERSLWFERKQMEIRKILHITSKKRVRNYDPTETLKDKRARLIAMAAQAKLDKQEFERMGYDV